MGRGGHFWEKYSESVFSYFAQVEMSSRQQKMWGQRKEHGWESKITDVEVIPLEVTEKTKGRRWLLWRREEQRPVGRTRVNESVRDKWKKIRGRTGVLRMGQRRRTRERRLWVISNKRDGTVEMHITMPRSPYTISIGIVVMKILKWKRMVKHIKCYREDVKENEKLEKDIGSAH